MRGIAFMLALAFLALALGGCSSNPPRDPGAVPLASGKGGLLGNVYANDGHQTPLGDANVIVSPGTYFLTSDERGKFVQRDMAPGTYHIQVGKSGYEGYPQDVVIKADEYTEIAIGMDPLSR
ncbi:MAG: carboxypeptidase-like regulatory domain-containing protein [bacterium]